MTFPTQAMRWAGSARLVDHRSASRSAAAVGSLLSPPTPTHQVGGGGRFFSRNSPVHPAVDFSLPDENLSPHRGVR
jgi:hypothetical protein